MRQSREEPINHRDLGALEGAVLLFGGPYSNLQATEALLRSWQGACTHAICTGDFVAYGGDPAATVAAVRAFGCPVVAGNCEKQLAEDAEDCGCGFDAGSACDVLSGAWYAHARGQISEADRAWMAGRPDIVSFTHHGARYGVIHGGFSDISRFIWSTTADDVLMAEWDLIDRAIGPVDHVIAGHSGLPFERQMARGRWINAGVIGMPPHDGMSQTRYALLDAGQVAFHALEYDAGAACDAMERAGLTQGYHRALLTGYWPSEDILPEALRVSSLAKG